jgi:serine-type D-Ala-D-Ala carboxypeptidase/endopeptidase (penicillin-binding protein 4)
LIENGSGLSRSERTSAQALTGLLQHAAASPHAQVFANSLGIAGVDGTVMGMRNRNPQSEALGNALLKTGSLNGVTALAGYATGRSGQRYSIVAIINHTQAQSARPALDKLVEWTIRDEK